MLADVYRKLPTYLQNAVVSIYGYKLKGERYGSAGSTHAEFLRSNETKTLEEMAIVQDALLVGLLRDAITHVPYYRQLANRERFCAADITSREALALFPILEKDTIRRQPLDFIDQRHAQRRDLIKLSTSGTSGTPLTIWCDRDSRSRHYAFWTRLRRWYDLPALSRRATFFGRTLVPIEQRKPPYWRRDFFQNNLLCSSYHLAKESIAAYTGALNDYKPEELIGYPSSIYTLARGIIDQRLAIEFRPKVIITTAETLLPYQRRVIEEAFGCIVVNQYGCTEMAMFASECPAGTMHFHPEHGITELSSVDDSGEAFKKGEIVCTGLTNSIMPLIRYRIGDIVTIAKEEHCSCRLPFQVISDIEGRLDDTIITPDGRYVGRLDPVFKGNTGIVFCQIRQDVKDAVTLLIVPDNAYDAQVEQDLRNELAKRLGTEMKVDIRLVASIEKSNSGKFRPVVSTITSDFRKCSGGTNEY